MGRVKINLKEGESKIKKFKDIAKKRTRDILEKEITKSIERGVSPVDKKGRFDKYSDTYLKQIKGKKIPGKRQRPVNLKVTGDLLKSLKVKVTNKGLRISFDNKLADIHNRRGAGKSKTVRRMLPTEKGEQFNRSIRRRLTEVLDHIANNIFKG